MPPLPEKSDAVKRKEEEFRKESESPAAPEAPSEGTETPGEPDSK